MAYVTVNNANVTSKAMQIYIISPCYFLPSTSHLSLSLHTPKPSQLRLPIFLVEFMFRNLITTGVPPLKIPLHLRTHMHHTSPMAKSINTRFTMISSHSTAANPAKRYVRDGNLCHDVVEGDAARAGVLEDEV